MPLLGSKTKVGCLLIPCNGSAPSSFVRDIDWSGVSPIVSPAISWHWMLIAFPGPS